MGTQTEGTHHPGRAHTEGAHPHLPAHVAPGTVSPPGTGTHSLPTAGEVLTP